MENLDRHSKLLRNDGLIKNRRIMIGIPMTGLVRAEWALARYGQVIPCNWSTIDSIRWLDQYTPLDFLVADARNIIVQNCLDLEFEWLLQIDSDVILPYDTFIQLNQYLLKPDVPFLSGLYFTKSRPSEPLIYRGRGNSYYTDWKVGDKVWVDGIPSGLTLIHSSILKVLSEESDEYEVEPGRKVKRVYDTPGRTWYDPEKRSWLTQTGTEDLELCSRIMENDTFKKAGWDKYQDMEFPFLCDTNMFARHIDPDGIAYPSNNEEREFTTNEKE